MTSKRPLIPIEIEVSRRPRRWLHRVGFWALVAGFIAAMLVWFQFGPPGAIEPRSPASPHAAQETGPPWRLGPAEARFTITFYADLECPYCKDYAPQLLQWVRSQPGVELQWHHLPLAAHEPAASAEARLAECTGADGGPSAFWQAIQWIYAHTRSDGHGLPEGLRYPELSPAIEKCLASDRLSATIRAQAEEAMNAGVTATPSLRLHDRATNQSVLLQGPMGGDALLSAMDMLAANPMSAGSPTEMPADVVGDMPR